MDIQKEREEFERFKAKQIGIDYETLKNDLDDCERRFPNNRYAGWNFKSDWELWQEAKSQAVPEGFVLVPHDVAKRCMGHISIAMCHPNSSNAENDVMQMDLDILESKVEAQEQSHESD